MQTPTILVAEDDRHVHADLRRRLGAPGSRVIESSDRLGVLGRCVDGQVDAIPLDRRMPNGDVRSIARGIRSENDVPTVVVSGYGKEQFRSILTELCDVPFLPEPFHDKRLARLLRSIAEPARAAWPVAALTAETRVCG